MNPRRAADDGRAQTRWALAAFYGVVGIAHLAATDRFLPIVPDWVPAPRFVVIATGLCEIAGALALTMRRLRRLAGLALALYAVCVFPANVKHASEPVDLPPIPSSWWYHAPRLAIQPVLAWWALYAVHLVDWPFSRRRSLPPATRQENQPGS